MKSLLAASLVLLLLPMLPGVAAQEPVTTHLADDGAGDVRVSFQGQSTSAPGDLFGAADLRSLDVTETPDTFVFTLGVQTLAPQAEGPLQGNTQYFVHFLQHDRQYRIRITRLVLSETTHLAQLQGYDPGRGGYFTVGLPLDLAVDAATNTLQATVPRELMLDSNGADPHPDRPLSGFRAASTGLYLGGRGFRVGAAIQSFTVGDAMPNSGNATVDLRVQYGVRQSEVARLSSATPTRASNGEATTFVYQVQAWNRAPAEQTFTLSTTQTPAGWTVKLPASQISIPGNGSVLLPILVTTPFTHTHGTFQTFIVEMESLSDSSAVGRVQLGVRYMNPPQPAGHHNVLWFHSEAGIEDELTGALAQAFGGGATAYMNAAEGDADPADQGRDVPAENRFEATNPAATQLYTWEVPLSPGLQMGLDFNLADTGVLLLNVRSPTGVSGGFLSGYLAHFEPSNGTAPTAGQGFAPARGRMTILADLNATAAELPAGEIRQLEAVLTPRAEADFVPFQKGASLVLFLNLTATRPDPAAATVPAIVPGSSLQLPLFEYHDPVDDIFVSDVGLRVNSAQDRFANPGGTVLYNLTLENGSGSEAAFDIDLTGTNVAWASLLPAQRTLTLQPGASQDFWVVVRVPKDVVVPTNPAAERPAADLVVSATHQTDLSQRALVRLHTTVTDARVADDARAVAAIESSLGQEEETPGPAALLALGALGVAVALRRRKA